MVSNRLNKELTENREAFAKEKSDLEEDLKSWKNKVSKKQNDKLCVEKELHSLESELEKIKQLKLNLNLLKLMPILILLTTLKNLFHPYSALTFAVFLQKSISFQSPFPSLTPFAGLNLTPCTRARPRRPSTLSMTGR